MTVLFSAKELLWNKNGSRTHEHWVQIEKNKKQFTFYLGDERGTIQAKIGNLDDLLHDAFSEINYYGMEIETDLTNHELKEKEKVQFT